MIESILYETLDSLAERYIPMGKHKWLHVDSRETWKNFMIVMLQKKVIKPKISTITECALNWEIILVKRACMYN